MDLSIIIINWNTRELLKSCLKSVFSAVKQIDFEVFVVDNGSWDGSPEMVKAKLPRVMLIQNDRNLGFARANNIAIKRAAGRYIALVNSDIVISEEAAEEIVRFLDENPRIGAAAPQYMNSDGSKQNSFDNFPSLTTELINKSLLRAIFPGKYPSKKIDYEGPLSVESVIGAFFVLRVQALESVGLLDEGYFFFLEETDLCLRLKNAGWRIVHIPWIKIHHLQGQSKDRAPGKAWIEYYRSTYRFFRKNRAKASYIILRILKLVKLMVNFLLTTGALLVTFCMQRRLRRKFLIYSQLLLWHLKLCPGHMGLREVLPEKETYFSVRRRGIKWKVKKRFKTLLPESNGIDFEDLAHSEKVELLKDSKIKTLALVRFAPGDEPKEFLIKHYKCAGISVVLSYILRRSKAEKELVLSRKFSLMGIPTILPVAIGVKRKFRILSGSWVIAEKIQNSADLEAFLTEGKNISQPFSRRKVIEQYARLARSIHDHGIVQSDFDPNNILIEGSDDQNFRLYFIDYERVKHFRRISHGKRAWSLAKLNRFSRGSSEVEKMRFLKAYVGDRPLPGIDFKTFARKILVTGEQVLKRDIRRAGKNALKTSSKIGSLSYRGIHCYYRKSHLKQKKYRDRDIREIIDEVFKLDIKSKGPAPGCRSLEAEINGVKKSFFVFTCPSGGQPPNKDTARGAWRVLNSLLKIDLPTLFPVAWIEGRKQELKDLVIVESPGRPVIQKKLSQIQTLKGSMPDAHLEKIKT
ncbi:MAG: glycosyltransferase, partial [Desulfobacterales bacterium]